MILWPIEKTASSQHDELRTVIEKLETSAAKINRSLAELAAEE
jgi:hypothetical protein